MTAGAQRPRLYVPAGVIVPPRIADWLEQQVDFGVLRQEASETDHTLNEVLYALHSAALDHRISLERSRAKTASETAASSSWVSAMTFAASVGVGVRRVQQLAAAGDLDARKVGRRWQIRRPAAGEDR